MATSVSAAARFKLVFFTPMSALTACKEAVFAAGAGRYPGPGNYTECCWASTGTGQFRPGDKANPNIGTVGALEEVQEARVETLCVGEDVTRKAVDALKRYVDEGLEGCSLASGYDESESKRTCVQLMGSLP